MSKKAAWAMASCTAIGAAGGFMVGTVYTALAPVFLNGDTFQEAWEKVVPNTTDITSIPAKPSEMTAPTTFSIRSHTTEKLGKGDFTIAVQPGEDCLFDVRKLVAGNLIPYNHAKPVITCTYQGHKTVVPENKY